MSPFSVQNPVGVKNLLRAVRYRERRAATQDFGCFGIQADTYSNLGFLFRWFIGSKGMGQFDDESIRRAFHQFEAEGWFAFGMSGQGVYQMRPIPDESGQFLVIMFADFVQPIRFLQGRKDTHENSASDSE